MCSITRIYDPIPVTFTALPWVEEGTRWNSDNLSFGTRVKSSDITPMNIHTFLTTVRVPWGLEGVPLLAGKRPSLEVSSLSPTRVPQGLRSPKSPQSASQSLTWPEGDRVKYLWLLGVPYLPNAYGKAVCPPWLNAQSPRLQFIENSLFYDLLWG